MCRLVRDLVGLVAARGASTTCAIGTHTVRSWTSGGARVRATVRTAIALTGEERRQLAGRIERALGKRAMLAETVDTSLLGGFVAQVGSLILDGSLDGQLQRMRERLARG